MHQPFKPAPPPHFPRPIAFSPLTWYLRCTVWCSISVVFLPLHSIINSGSWSLRASATPTILPDWVIRTTLALTGLVNEMAISHSRVSSAMIHSQQADAKYVFMSFSSKLSLGTKRKTPRKFLCRAGATQHKPTSCCFLSLPCLLFNTSTSPNPLTPLSPFHYPPLLWT